MKQNTDSINNEKPKSLNKLSNDCSNNTKSLDELPDTVYIPLGRRGMESASLKECSRCSAENLLLLSKSLTTEEIAPETSTKDELSEKKEIIDYMVQCQECQHQFIIRLKRLSLGEKPVQTFVFVLNKSGNSEQWLGNLF
jgi:hypothetical protein